MFAFFSFLLFVSQSFAYIPEYSTILRRWAEATPKTPYGVEWTVTYTEGNKKYTAEETWWFKNETTAEVTVVGTGNLTNLLNLNISYDAGKKRMDGQSTSIPQEMVELLLVQKNPSNIRNRLVQQGFAGQDSLRDRPGIRAGQEENYKAPPFIELTRSRGMVSYWLKGSQNGGIAILQDIFLPTKFVFPTAAEAFFENYAKVGETTLLPKKKTYRWSQGEVEMIQKRIITKKPTDKTTTVSKTTDVPLVQDFYRRFR